MTRIRTGIVASTTPIPSLPPAVLDYFHFQRLSSVLILNSYPFVPVTGHQSEPRTFDLPLPARIGSVRNQFRRFIDPPIHRY